MQVAKHCACGVKVTIRRRLGASMAEAPSRRRCAASKHGCQPWRLAMHALSHNAARHPAAWGRPRLPEAAAADQIAASPPACCRHALQAAGRSPDAPVVILDVMDTIVTDPFFQVRPGCGQPPPGQVPPHLKRPGCGQQPPAGTPRCPLLQSSRAPAAPQTPTRHPCCLLAQTMPRFFNMSFKELLDAKHPTAWIEFEKALITEQARARWSLRPQGTPHRPLPSCAATPLRPGVRPPPFLSGRDPRPPMPVPCRS
jgi:hypothetical protein